MEVFENIDNMVVNLENKNNWITQLREGKSYDEIKRLIKKVYNDSIIYYKKVILSLRFKDINIEDIVIAPDKAFCKESKDKKLYEIKLGGFFNLVYSDLDLHDIKKIADIKHKEFVNLGIENIKKKYPFIDYNKIL